MPSPPKVVEPDGSSEWGTLADMFNRSSQECLQTFHTPLTSAGIRETGSSGIRYIARSFHDREPFEPPAASTVWPFSDFGASKTSVYRFQSVIPTEAGTQRGGSLTADERRSTRIRQRPNCFRRSCVGGASVDGDKEAAITPSGPNPASRRLRYVLTTKNTSHQPLRPRWFGADKISGLVILSILHLTHIPSQIDTSNPAHTNRCIEEPITI
jgi:hypothetical protein